MSSTRGPALRRCHVVVGGGSAGLVLTKRLLDAGYNVILIERGTEDADKSADIQSPLDWGFAATDPLTDSEAIHSLTLPQVCLRGRQLLVPQGSGLGGSSNINACIWTAGHRGVFDEHWPGQWSADQIDNLLIAVHDLVKPSFVTPVGLAEKILKRGDSSGTSSASTTSASSASAGDGSSSSGSAARARAVSRDGSRYAESTDKAPHAWWSGAPHRGYYTTSLSSHGETPVRTKLKSLVLDHNKTAKGGKLILHSGAEAEYILFEGTRASGVKVRLSNGTHHVIEPHGGGEIVLCAGVYETPRILISSGLKNFSWRGAGCVAAQEAAQARYVPSPNAVVSPAANGISKTAKAMKSKSTLPGAIPDFVPLVMIGEHLQDHVILPLLCVGNWWEGRGRNFGNGGGTRQQAEMSEMAGAGKDETGGDVRMAKKATKAHALARKPFLSARLRGLIDAVIVAVRCLWNMRSDPSLPPNSVHGWIDLDADGNIFNPTLASAGASPSAQLVLIDGRIAPGIAVELLLPRLQGPFWYVKLVRPVFARILGLLVRLSVVQWLCGLCFGFLVCLTKPSSRGRVSRPDAYSEPAVTVGRQGKERDGIDPPLSINPQYFQDKHTEADSDDQRILFNAMHTAHGLLEDARQQDGLVYLEVLPGMPFAHCRARDYFKSYLGLFGSSFYHGCGTCKMVPDKGDGMAAAAAATAAKGVVMGAGAAALGEALSVDESSARDAQAVFLEGTGPNTATSSKSTRASSHREFTGVVNENLKVNGISGLRIADASVFPCIPSGPIAALCMAVGEAAFRFLMVEDSRFLDDNGNEAHTQAQS